jgi:altronate dehydratase small subunit
MSHASALLMATDDDVAVALADVGAGTRVSLGSGRVIVALESIPQGHKLAVRDIGAGGQVRKYGVSIGRATVAIDVGQHVHVHNVESARLRGDL